MFVCALAGADWCPRELHIHGVGLMTAIRHVTEAVKEVEARGDDSDASVQVVAVVLEKLGHAHLFDSYMGVVNSRDPAPDGTFKDMVMKMVAEESAAGAGAAAAAAKGLLLLLLLLMLLLLLQLL